MGRQPEQQPRLAHVVRRPGRGRALRTTSAGGRSSSGSASATTGVGLVARRRAPSWAAPHVPPAAKGSRAGARSLPREPPGRHVASSPRRKFPRRDWSRRPRGPRRKARGDATWRAWLPDGSWRGLSSPGWAARRGVARKQARDPMACERDPCVREGSCLAHPDCSAQCVDDPECVQRCAEVESRSDGLGH